MMVNQLFLCFQRRERVEREVKRLREEISVKKTAVTTATKGIPANKIEVRPQDQQPAFSGPTSAFNPMLVGLSNEAQMILAASMSASSGSYSPTKQLMNYDKLLEMNPDLAAMENYEPSTSRQSLMPPQSLAPLPRSAKISMDEAAEAAVSLARDQPQRSMPGAQSRLPNGRPPAIQTGT